MPEELRLTRKCLLFIGRVIRDGGSVVLGQDQDSVGGEFVDDQSFIGELASVNIWSRVLDDQEIATLSKSCLAGEGGVFKRSDFKGHTRGGVQLIDASCVALFPIANRRRNVKITH